MGELRQESNGGSGVQYADEYLQSATSTATVANRISEVSDQDLLAAFLQVAAQGQQVGAKILTREAQSADYGDEDDALLAQHDGVDTVSSHLLDEMSVRTAERHLWPPLGHTAVAQAAASYPDMFNDPEWLAASGLNFNGIDPDQVVYALGGSQAQQMAA